MAKGQRNPDLERQWLGAGGGLAVERNVDSGLLPATPMAGDGFSALATGVAETG